MMRRSSKFEHCNEMGWRLANDLQSELLINITVAILSSYYLKDIFIFLCQTMLAKYLGVGIDKNFNWSRYINIMMIV